MEKFRGIAEFVATVEAASFVHAAQRLGMTPSGVSKAVSRLESRLGLRLLRRSTRRLTVTEAGAECYQKFRQFLAELDEMEHAMSEPANPAAAGRRVQTPQRIEKRAHGRVEIRPVRKQQRGIEVALHETRERTRAQDRRRSRPQTSRRDSPAASCRSRIVA